eukprot:COSAG05_NODE_1459_length_4826_cov_2.560609_4_plen_392_part_00
MHPRPSTCLTAAYLPLRALLTEDPYLTGEYGSYIVRGTQHNLVAQQQKGWHVTYARGCNICDWVPKGFPNQPCSVGPNGKGLQLPPPDPSNISAAVAVAKQADVAILFLGADQTTEAENFDRETLGLVGAQEELLAAVTAVQKNVVMVLIHGGPIDVESAQENHAVRAIVDAFQPGELGADAIMDVLDGTVSPSGRLPYTAYFKNFTKRDIREVNLTAGDGLTYWWHTKPQLYPFGWGLSYTNFSFAWSNTPPLGNAEVALPTTTREISDFSVDHSVVVTNTGTRTSDVVALAFIARPPGMPIDTNIPLRKLFGFERFSDVPPGENRTAYFAPDAQALGVVRENGDRVLQPGSYVIECGGVDTKVTRTLALKGQPILVERSSEWLKATTGL